jgi:hypothetical protein
MHSITISVDFGHSALRVHLPSGRPFLNQKGRLGITSGQGFYSYPNPAFAQPGFI